MGNFASREKGFPVNHSNRSSSLNNVSVISNSQINCSTSFGCLSPSSACFHRGMCFLQVRKRPSSPLGNVFEKSQIRFVLFECSCVISNVN